MTPRVRPQHGFVALGLVCCALGIQHLLLEGEGLGTVIESFIILSLTGLLFYTAAEVPDRDISAPNCWRALKLSVGTALAFAALAAAIWVTWWVEGATFELSFLLSFAFTLGAIVGSRAGLYAVEAEERLAEAEELSKLLSINQRVLRHNIRNELSVALGYLELLEQDTNEAERTENVEIVRDHLEALLETSNRTRRLVSVWKADDVREFDLSVLLRDQVAEATRETTTASIATELPADCRIVAHPSLPLAFEEAIKNALRHNSPDVAVTVSVHQTDDETVQVLITDTGSGIPQKEREILGSSEETPLEHTEGVGLWMIYWVVTRSGGTVEFVENDPQGTIIRIELPRDGPDTPVRVR